jgi:hypothetical protein
MKFKHTVDIPRAPRGTLDKCREELAELADADQQNNRWHSVIEAADLINSTYTFIWRKYRVPFFVVIVIALLSGIYKPIVRWLRKYK